MELGTIWAKRGGRAGEGGPCHPLLCHLIDVAEIARQILDRAASLAEIRWLADGLGVDEASTKRWLIIFAGLHDLGKACRPFQEQIRGNSHDTPHGTVSTRILRKSLTQPPFGFKPAIASRVAIVIGAHHGAIPSVEHVNEVEKKTVSAEWRDAWPQLTDQFLAIFPPPEAAPTGFDTARAMWLAGFISAADWVGSNAGFFEYAAMDGSLPANFSFTDYQRQVASPAAFKALHDLGWLAVPATTEPLSFRELFPKIEGPNDLQDHVIHVSDQMNEPGLVIIEAPMGEGKTEAALYLADQAAVRWGMRGAYIALPTMATSNQMFSRVSDFLGRRYKREFVQVQLLHGHASLSEDVEALRVNFDGYLSFTDEIRGVDGEGEEAALASAVASGWFTGRKQGLLSPFGVGTIDQVLLSVLPIKHFFVRLFGLSNKTVILDEVHAYDSYMTTLMERLIGWLAAMNCQVILLSATLPAEKRARLLTTHQTRGANQDQDPANEPNASIDYPRISWVSGERAGSTSFEVSERGRKDLVIRWLELDPTNAASSLAVELDRALANGGCAAVICNTVKRAQDVFTTLKESGLFAADELDLLHARFLFKDRHEREARAIRRFGKPNDDRTNSSCRPRRMVLVATQVIEQSLDLDFDLMVTDLAPIDLLLQRAGRLHRHARAFRPSGLETPALLIVAPSMADDNPKFDSGSEYVYFPHILLRTWWELKDRAQIVVPGDVSSLIEAVYGDHDAPSNLPKSLAERWRASAGEMEKEVENDAGEAEQWRIRWPGNGGELAELMPVVLEDEDADTKPEIRAKTRLAELSATVVCHRGPFKQAIFDDASPPLNLSEPNRALVRTCLENSVSISRRDVASALLKEGPPKPWAKNSFLRTMRCYELDEEGGPGERRWRLVIDNDLGALIESTKGE